MIKILPASIRYSYTKGFSLVEMMVAMSLYSVVSIIVLGSILVLINGNRQNQVEQNVMSSLTMIMDSMTREIRSGVDYFCRDNVFASNVSGTRDCDEGALGISFREITPRLTVDVEGDRVAYQMRVLNNGRGVIVRKLGTDGDVERITPDQIDILELRFFVTGTEPLIDPSTQDLTVNATQPAVTIIIRAREVGQTSDDDVVTLQTTVVQRILDI